MTAKEECKAAYDSFDRVRNFSKEIPNCIWDIDIELPEPPTNYKAIHNYGKPKEDRTFPYLDSSYIKHIDSLSSNDTERKEFLDQEWDRRRNGLWFYNGDKLEWVTGHYYMTLQYWLIPIEDLDGGFGNPKFVDLHRDITYAIWWAKKHEQHTGLAYLGTRRSGKALDINTLLPTPSGFKLMKDIQAGDVVFDQDGKPTNVTHATEVQLNRNVNRVWFDDDTYLDADDDHQWEVTLKKDRAYCRKKGKEVPKKVMTTKQIKEFGIFYGNTNERNFHIEVLNKPVEYKQQDLPIDPYLFGYWLGDGNSYAAKISVGRDDLLHLESYLDSLNIKYITREDRTCYAVTVLGEGREINELGQFVSDEESMHYKLNQLGVRKKKKDDDIFKHIPDIYKLSSSHQRKELIRGIMDADAHISPASHGLHIEITQKNKILAEDIAEVLRSLGEKVRIANKTARLKREDKEDYTCPVYRVNFLSQFNPFKMPRKASIWQPPKHNNRRIKSIEKIEELESIPVKCISVDSERELYLAGKHYTVTHNTMLGAAHGYWDTTERYNALFGLQSKTDADSKTILMKLVGSWQRLPSFWKPIDTGYTTVSREMMFAEPQRKSTKTQKREYKEVLNSRIYAYPSTEAAMDGTRTTFQFQDEFGKRQESDAYKTQQISKICCVVGRKVVGFAFWATTVEEMEKGGGEAAHKIWEASNPRKLNDNGRTASTMVRLFFPAEYGLFEGGFIDEWGYSDLDGARSWLNSEEKGLDGDNLVDWKRKFPRKIDDCFAVVQNNNNYNKRKLYEQYMYSSTLEPIAEPVRGNFMWDNGIQDSNVIFKPNDDGKWLVAWMPPEEDRNKKERFAGHWKPTRDDCKTGADPFAHRQTTEKGSMGAAFTILQSHYKFPKMKMSWVCQYLARTNHPHEQAEDMIMQNVFYSSEFLCEKNVYGVLDYFHKRGYDGYCLFNPLDPDSLKKRIKGHRGMPMTGSDAGEALSSITQAHIEDYIGYNQETKTHGYCPFLNLISDWQKFDPNKRTAFDCAMAAGMALIATHKPKHTVEVSYTLSDWLPKYSNTGNTSRRVR